MVLNRYPGAVKASGCRFFCGGEYEVGWCKVVWCEMGSMWRGVCGLECARDI